MTIQQELFWPSTCSCGVILSWDDTTTNAPLSLVGFVFKDPAHSILDDATAFSAIMDEDDRKDNVLRGAIDNLAAQLSSTGSAGGSLKDGITYNFSYTGTAPNRVLNVSFTGITLTNQQKRVAQTWCDNNIGVGKVVVN